MSHGVSNDLFQRAVEVYSDYLEARGRKDEPRIPAPVPRLEGARPRRFAGVRATLPRLQPTVRRAEELRPVAE